jgi:hypothetical protein
MSGGVIIVAPVEALWPTRAQSVLADARLFTARLYDARLLALMVRSGGVRTIAIDVRAARSAAALRECAVANRAMRIALIHEGLDATTLGPWQSERLPDDPAAMVALLVAPR